MDPRAWETFAYPWFLGNRFILAAVSFYIAAALRTILWDSPLKPVLFAGSIISMIGIGFCLTQSRELAFFSLVFPMFLLGSFRIFPIFLWLFYLSHFAIIVHALYRDWIQLKGPPRLANSDPETPEM